MFKPTKYKRRSSNYREGFEWRWTNAAKEQKLQVTIEVILKGGKSRILIASSTKYGKKKKNMACIHIPSDKYKFRVSRTNTPYFD